MWLILNLFLIIVHGCDIFIFVLRPLCGRIALAWICAGCPVLETCLRQFASDQTKMLAESMANLVGFLTRLVLSLFALSPRSLHGRMKSSYA